MKPKKVKIDLIPATIKLRDGTLVDCLMDRVNEKSYSVTPDGKRGEEYHDFSFVAYKNEPVPAVIPNE